MQLYPVNEDHPICGLWEDQIAPAILSVMDEHCSEPTCLDLVRIGLEETIAETLVWIGVEADSLTPASGNVVVALCEEILRKAGGLTSVRVEIRETALCRSALHPPQQLSSPMRFKYGEPFTASIGLPISCHSQPHIIGTGGLYMRDGENGAPCCLLAST